MCLKALSPSRVSYPLLRSLSLSVFVLIQPFCRYMSRAFAQTHEHVNTLTRRSNESRANHRVLIEENFCQADTNHFSGNIRTYSTVWLLFERRWITFSMGGFRAPFRWILHMTYELLAKLSYFLLAPYFWRGIVNYFPFPDELTIGNWKDGRAFLFKKGWNAESMRVVVHTKL